ncbi:MAG: hypothetical protein ACRDOH_34700 [Streptosporangiaceae bacterium]
MTISLGVEMTSWPLPGPHRQRTTRHGHLRNLAKLARTAKARAVLQAAFYSRRVRGILGGEQIFDTTGAR